MKVVLQLALIVVTVALLVGLQLQYWRGENGRADLLAQRAQIEEQISQNQALILNNRVLRADIEDLKSGLIAVEEHARLDLGMIKPNETFVQISTATNTSNVPAMPEVNPEDAIESIP